MTLEMNIGLGESIQFPCMKLFKTSLPIEQCGSSFCRQQMQYLEDLSFWSFLYVSVFKLLQLCEPPYHIYHTALLYDFLQ